MIKILIFFSIIGYFVNAINTFQQKPDEIQFTENRWAFKETYINLLHWRAPFPSYGTIWPAPFFQSTLEKVDRYQLGNLKYFVSGVKPQLLENTLGRYEDILNNDEYHSEFPSHLNHFKKDFLDLKMFNDLPIEENLDPKYHPENMFLMSSFYLESLQEVEVKIYKEKFFTFMNNQNPTAHRSRFSSESNYLKIHIHIEKDSPEEPSQYMNEAYILMILKNQIFIYASEIWGFLRAIESLSQLQWNIHGFRNTFFLNQTFIVDKPRFPHRGVLVDTSRHFISKEILMMNLDAMSYSKMNVLHLHMVDDQSFSFQPKFNHEFTKGSYNNRFYNEAEIKEIIEYARLRGIRVIPEIDMPDHTNSWSKVYPEIFSKCKDYDGNYTGYLGPLDPINENTYKIVKSLINSVLSQFKDAYIHLGGDEVDTSCWNARPSIYKKKILQKFLDKVQEAIDEINKENTRQIFWEEVIENQLSIKNNSMIQLWKSNLFNFDFSNYKNVTLDVISSTCWYLDRTENILWINFYLCDPDQYRERLENVNFIGGEACMWTEYQNDDTILQRIWPTTLATAERLWSPAHVNSIEKAGPRYEEQSCRLLYRGIPQGSTNGPSYCSRSNGILSRFFQRSFNGRYYPISTRPFIINEICSRINIGLIIFIIISIILFYSILYAKLDRTDYPMEFSLVGCRIKISMRCLLFSFYVFFSIFVLFLQSQQ